MWQSALTRTGGDGDRGILVPAAQARARAVGVGTKVTYFVWLAAMKGRAQPEQSFALQNIRALDSRLANRYVILPLTGLIMIFVSDGVELTTFWILAAIVLYALVGVIAGAYFAPSLRRQTELVTTGDVASDAYEAASRRTRTTGLLTMVLVAGILYLMVMKPTP